MHDDDDLGVENPDIDNPNVDDDDFNADVGNVDWAGTEQERKQPSPEKQVSYTGGRADIKGFLNDDNQTVMGKMSSLHCISLTSENINPVIYGMESPDHTHNYTVISFSLWIFVQADF